MQPELMTVPTARYRMPHALEAETKKTDPPDAPEIPSEEIERGEAAKQRISLAVRARSGPALTSRKAPRSTLRNTSRNIWTKA